MSYAQFRKFRSTAMRLYQSRDYGAALDLLDQSAQSYPDQADQVEYWRICLLALSSTAPDALAAFQRALDQGYWYPPDTLHTDPDLACLQNHPEFERLVAVCGERFA